jgi:hypothetical protein
MATTTDVRAPRDPSKPLTERLGGRFLTSDDVDRAGKASVDPSPLEYAAMNLKAMLDGDPEYAATMTADDLVPLLALADAARENGRFLTELAGNIEGVAWTLWQAREDA